MPSDKGVAFAEVKQFQLGEKMLRQRLRLCP